jgi:hypothetical protein
VFELRGDDLRMAYAATGSEHVVEYHDAQRDHIFRGAEIATLESAIGTLLTVPLRFIPDPLELTLTQRLTFTLLLPKIVLQGTTSSFETVAIRTSHRAGDGPAVAAGPLQRYEVLILQGVARLTKEEPASTHSLPPQIFKHWFHSHEEDTGDVEVYRPSDHTFPVSRGRTGFEIQPDGTFIQHDIGPSDVPQRVPGRWKAEDGRWIRVELNGAEQRSFTLTIIEVGDQVLKVVRQ